MMAEESGQEKTEDPTPKKIEDSYKEGQVPQSREIASMGVLFAAMGFLYFGVRNLLQGVMQVMRAVFGELDRPFSTGTLSAVLDVAGDSVGWILLKFLGLLVLIGIVVGFGQIGWHPSDKLLKPSLSKLNPINGVQKFFSKNALVEFAKSLLKLAIIGVIAYQMLTENIDEIVGMPRAGLHEAISLMGTFLYKFVKKCLLWLLVLAILDLFWQRYSNFEKMKMTKQEVKDETKNREGDQQVKGRMRGQARQRIMQQIGLLKVPEADVVVTNPDHYAIALKYVAGEMKAPMVVARGQDLIAEKIKAVARKHGIPRVENRQLARILYKTTRVGDEVPPELYATVAELLAFVYRLKHQHDAA